MPRTPWNRRFWLVPAFLIALFLLYLSLRGIQWRLVAATIRSISIRYALLSVAIGLLPMLLRAERWRILLEAEAPVSFATTFWAVAAGYFGNNFLPARGGELVRSQIIRSRSKLSLSYVLATALSERAADAVALVLAGSIAMATLPQAKAWTEVVRTSCVAIGTLGILALVCLPYFKDQLEGYLARWPSLQSITKQMLLGVSSFHNPMRLSKFLAFTVAIWAIDALATSILAFSLSIEMSITVAFLLIVALSLSSAIPSMPGYIGVYQFVAITVLKPFGISPSAAIAFMLVTQALSYLTTSLLGILALTYFTPVLRQDLNERGNGSARLNWRLKTGL